MKTRVVDVLSLLIVLGMMWALVWMCAESSSVEAREQDCNTAAADRLAGGTGVFEVLEEHARCLRGER